MYYFQREVLSALDIAHITNSPPPPFSMLCVLWRIVFAKDIQPVCDLTIPNAAVNYDVSPSLMLNPSQDYWHLKQRRNEIQHYGYTGLIAPSTRCPQGGRMVVLFNGQSGNLHTIDPFDTEIRLITTPGNAQFANYKTDTLNFTACEAQIVGMPSGLATYNNFVPVSFNH
jgi:hypothetical protein